MNPLALGRAVLPTLSEANLKATVGGSNGDAIVYGTMGVSSGKWYWEITPTTVDAVYESMGVNDFVLPPNASSVTGANWLVYQVGGQFQNGTNPAVTGSAYGNSFTSNDVIGIALDMDNGKIFFSKNGVFQNSGDPVAGTNPAASGLSGIKYPVQYFWSANSVRVINYGQRPFTYTPPTGFVRLNTFNLTTPTIGATASTTANKYFDATLYNGNSSTQTINNASGFYPDFNWLKRRNSAGSHVLANSVVGGTQQLFSNLTNAEQTDTRITNGISSSGIALGNNSGGTGDTNISGGTYVAWQWLANAGTAVTNTQGSITSTVSASTTAGFSIVTYTGSGSAATVGHGLGATPSMIIIKDRDNGTYDWNVYHASLSSPTTLKLYLNTTDAENNGGTNSGTWNSTAPTSTVFSLGTFLNVNKSGDNFVAYCFAPIAGYSAFGSYTGNGSTDGPFIFTGFRPRFVMIKLSSGSGSGWLIYDSSRNTYNLTDLYLQANQSNAEAGSSTDNPFDFLSNGFKARYSNSATNQSGGTFIYMAFAENPFKYANAR
jgi:hypothetical protein